MKPTPDPSSKIQTIAVLSLSTLAVLAVTAVAPALGRIQLSFPETTKLQLQMFLNFPALFMIPFSLVSGRLTLRFQKRHILLIGLVVYAISGVGSAFTESFALLLFLRAILGISLGMVTPMSFSLIADLYNGEKRTFLMGFSSAVATITAVFMSLISGWLALYNWRFALGAYGIGMLVFILVYFHLPEPPVSTNGKETSRKLPTLVYMVVLFTMFSIVIFNLISNNMAFYLKDTNLGDSAESGIAIAFYQGAQFLVAVSFNRIYRIFKNGTAIASLGISALGFMILFTAHHFWLIALAVFIIGMGIGTLVPYTALTVSNQVSSEVSGWALSLNTSAMFAGQFISPFIFSISSRIFGFTSIRYHFLTAAVMCAVVAIVILIARNLHRKNLPGSFRIIQKKLK